MGLLNTMLTRIDIKKVDLLLGCSARLAEKTALVELHLNEGYEYSAETGQRWVDGVGRLYPGDPMWGLPVGGWPGGFLVDTGGVISGFAAWVVALTVGFQRWARDAVWQGSVVSVDGAVVRLAIPYQRPAVFQAALRLALRHLLVWSGTPLADPRRGPLKRELDDWIRSSQDGGLAPNTLRFFAAARQRGMPTQIEMGLLRLGQGAQAERLDSSFTGKTSNIASRIARSKQATNQLLGDSLIPVPRAFMVADFEQAKSVARQLEWPVVIKPSNQDQGLGVVPGIRDEALLQTAFDAAAKYSPGAVMLEKHVDGEDYRILVVGGQMRMATRRIPGGVTGDGCMSVVELLDTVNADPRRGAGSRSLLIRLEVDAQALGCLEEQGLLPDSVPTLGRMVRLRRTANISTGGTALDVTLQVHPDNRALAERAARVIGLDIAGVDFLCPDISRSWREVGGAICEINAQPGFRPHWLGDSKRDINAEILDLLYKDKPSRVPTVAITGTNGKSTVARMLHHIWMATGKTAGVSTSQGLWIGHDLVNTQVLVGFPAARVMLNDPAIEAAVIELPRKGLIKFGHPCDQYDVAALLNVQDDHIGVDGIDTMEQMAELKAEVLERARVAIVVNADDPLCLAMRARAGTQRHILVAIDANQLAVQKHRAEGGEAVFIATVQSVRWLVLATGATEIRLMPLGEIPATMKGALFFNEQNALFAVALAWAQGLALETVRRAMASFGNTVEHNPGRYNFMPGFPFQVLLDYGHNPDGLRELCSVVSKLEVTGQRRLLSMQVGNRHKSHMSDLAPLLASVFDHFVLGCSPEFVKRSPDYAGDDPVGLMLSLGTQALMGEGVRPERIVVERAPLHAIRQAIDSAQAGDLLVLLAEQWDALSILKAY